jgi:1-deoxy-D-xylulose-5-phosphate synthase
MVRPSLEAAAILEQEGFSAAVVNCRFVKPLDTTLVEDAKSAGKVLVVEENIMQGGLSSAILELFSDAGLRNVTVRRMGLPDRFVEHGPVGVLREKYGLDTKGIVKEARDLCRQI